MSPESLDVLIHSVSIENPSYMIIMYYIFQYPGFYYKTGFDRPFNIWIIS